MRYRARRDASRDAYPRAGRFRVAASKGKKAAAKKKPAKKRAKAVDVEDAEIVQKGALYRATCKLCNGFIGAAAERDILLILIEGHKCGEQDA